MLETQKTNSEALTYFLVSFISINMGDIHHSAHEILQADFNNSHYVKKK